MRVPEALAPLVDQGVIDEVVRPLMSGKEAQVFVVRSRGEILIAKLYKASDQRSFKHRAQYVEGRKVRNSRDQRAMERRSRYGKEQIEQAWRSSEVDTLYRLRAAGVRVPEPRDFVDGVLLMELVSDAAGRPAPRLADVELVPAEARDLFRVLLSEIARMLCAGVVHGDLSDFNILLGSGGPVIIDFPQSVDASGNPHARKLLLRDVDNVTSFLARWAPELAGKAYGQQMWDLWSRAALDPEAELDGRWRPAARAPDRKEKSRTLMEELDALAAKARDRQDQGLAVRPARAPKFVVEEQRPAAAPPPADGAKKKRKRRKKKPTDGPAPEASPPAAEVDADPEGDEALFDDLDALLS